VRELEQCFRNVMIHGAYQPAATTRPDAGGPLATAELMARGELTADELVERYCRMVYAQCDSYEQTAKRTGLDWRTVKKKVGEARS
jgi:hypothetical protein